MLLAKGRAYRYFLQQRPCGELHEFWLDSRHCALHLVGCMKKKKMNYYIFSSQLKADQMPGPPREVQVTRELFLDRH